MNPDADPPAGSPAVLTVAIPTYRRPAYLAEALDSVAAAAARAPGLALDVVVSDNASGDETESVAGRDRGLRVSYFRNEANLGISENIVRAAERVTGEYVLLLSDDDLLLPGALSAIHSRLDLTPPVGGVSGPVRRFRNDDPGSAPARLFFPAPGGVDARLAAGRQAFETMFIRSLSVSGLVIRRDLVDGSGARRHAGSLYPQVYLAASAAAASDVAYLAEPIALVRDNRSRDWDYRHDLMAGAVLDILADLTAGRPWGRAARRTVTRRRVRAGYGPLLEARRHSFRSFWRVASALATVTAYRRSPVFWGIVIGIAVLGDRGIRLLRRLLRR